MSVGAGHRALLAFVEGTSPKVQTDVGLGPNHLTPLQKLIGAKLVALDSIPGKLRPRTRTDQRSPPRFVADISHLRGR